MPVSCETSNKGQCVHITVTGRFDCCLSRIFRDTYRHASGRDGVTYHVNLHEASYMDRSALGVLLLLREHAKSRGGMVMIEQPSEQSIRILKDARFDHLFTINATSTISSTSSGNKI